MNQQQQNHRLRTDSSLGHWCPKRGFRIKRHCLIFILISGVLALHPMESISLTPFNFARASSHVAEFNTCNKLLTQKLFKQGYRYHKLHKTFSKFYRRNYDLISKFQIGLKSLLCQGLSEPELYGDLVYELKKIVGSNNFSAQFIKIISHYKKIAYNKNVLQQTAYLVVNPITVGNFVLPL